MHVLILNLAMDYHHPAVGFTVPWANAIARRVDRVSVITHMAGHAPVEPNVTVHTLGKELGYSEPRRLARFYRLLAQVERGQRIDACFAHQATLFSILLSPVARVRRIPILLWYAHGAVSRVTRLAHAAVDRCVTSTPSGFRIESDKIHVIGQGIDTDAFRPPAAVAAGYDRRALTVGRVSETKGIDEMIDAARLLHERGAQVELEVVGEGITDKDAAHERALRQRVADEGLQDVVSFAGGVPFDEVPAAYHRGGTFLNLSETRSLDKAILEAMASGCVPLSRNESFRRIAAAEGFEHLIPAAGAAGLADAIERAIGAAGRDSLTGALRAVVVRDHSLDALSGKIVAHLQELSSGRRQPS